jgi:hypothetical protein
MDGVTTAFGLWDFPNNTIVRLNAYTEKKNETNGDVYVPTSDQWWLYVSDAQNEVFGFQDVPAEGSDALAFLPVADGLKMMSGQGLRDLARVLSHSSGFAKCLATRAVSQMYLQKVWSLPNMSKDDLAKIASQADVISQLQASLIKHRNLRILLEEAAVAYLK